jgi:hypothetical protein
MSDVRARKGLIGLIWQVCYQPRISQSGKRWLQFCHHLSRKNGGCSGLLSGVSWTPAASPYSIFWWRWLTSVWPLITNPANPWYQQSIWDLCAPRWSGWTRNKFHFISVMNSVKFIHFVNHHSRKRFIGFSTCPAKYIRFLHTLYGDKRLTPSFSNLCNSEFWTDWFRPSLVYLTYAKQFPKIFIHVLTSQQSFVDCSVQLRRGKSSGTKARNE